LTRALLSLYFTSLSVALSHEMNQPPLKYFIPYGLPFIYVTRSNH